MAKNNNKLRNKMKRQTKKYNTRENKKEYWSEEKWNLTL